MNKKSKLILSISAIIAALMLLVPLTQVDMPGGGGYRKLIILTRSCSACSKQFRLWDLARVFALFSLSR